MVTDEQVRLLRQKMKVAAAAAGMSVRLAYKWQQGLLPSQTKTERTWRTRQDPFEEVWQSEIDPLLEADKGLPAQGKTLKQLLVHREPTRFSMAQLRTMQRRVRD